MLYTIVPILIQLKVENQRTGYFVFELLCELLVEVTLHRFKRQTDDF